MDDVFTPIKAIAHKILKRLTCQAFQFIIHMDRQPGQEINDILMRHSLRQQPGNGCDAGSKQIQFRLSFASAIETLLKFLNELEDFMASVAKKSILTGL